MTRTSALRFEWLLQRAQRAAAQQRWPHALAYAGLAVLCEPERRAAFDLLRCTASALGDPHMARAYGVLCTHDDMTGADINSVTVEVRTTVQKSLHLVAGGDVMLGRQMPGWVALRGPEDPLADLRPYLQAADVSLVNLEVCVSNLGDFIDKGGRQPYYYHCPNAMLQVLVHAGIQVVCSGNNHAMDFGPQALTQHLQQLRNAGLLAFGAGTDALRAALPRYFQVGDATLAFIGIETETPAMAAEPGQTGVRYAPLANALRTVAGSIALARAHADYVIVSPHWGENWRDRPTPEIKALAQAWIDLGADAILGHSSHILQGVTFHRGCPIVYDMGTLLFDRVSQSTMRHSALFDLRWDATGRCTVTLRPVRLRTARAERARADDATHITQTLLNLSTALDPQTQWQICSEGLQANGQRAASPLRNLAKLPLHSAALHGPNYPNGAITRGQANALNSLQNNWVYPSPDHLDGLPGLWLHPLRVNSKLNILGARYASPVRPGRGFICEVYFHAAAPSSGQRIEARLCAVDDAGNEVFVYIHPVADSIHPPEQWDIDQVVCDRICVRPVQAVPPGRYRLCWTLMDLESKQLAPVDANVANIYACHVVLGDWLVADDAPNGVGGIADSPSLPRFAGVHPNPLWQTDAQTFWRAGARAWVLQALAVSGVDATHAPIDVVKFTHNVLVIRIRAGAQAFYFKAVGNGNRFEPALAQALYPLASQLLVPPIAVDVAQGFLLTPDSGQPLRDVPRAQHAQHWQRILPALAQLQINSIAHTSSWLALGVPDARLDRLMQGFRHLLDDPAALHQDQADGLNTGELTQARSLLPTLERVCQTLGNAAWSTAFDHGDLHTGNVLIQANTARLFDLDTAWVSHPFFTLLLLYHDQAKQGSQAQTEWATLTHAYLVPWSKHTQESLEDLRQQLDQALWAAHALRALMWAKNPNALERFGVKPQTLVTKWIRLWMQRRAELLDPQASCPTMSEPELLNISRAPSVQPARLATPQNPLLLTPEIIASVAGGVWSKGLKDLHFSGLSYSRPYMRDGWLGNLFVAAQYDARHTFTDSQIQSMAKAALHDGAAALIMPDRIAEFPSQVPVLRFPQDRPVLDLLGSHVRDYLFAGKRVLVSGTEGKTGFKNMLYHVLAPQISTHAIACSSNLDFSVMASLASIRQQDRVAIIEAAGTSPGRLAARSHKVKPHLFVLTEVGNEHLNFHGSQQAVIESKADIALGLVEGGWGILNADSRNFDATRQAVLKRKRVPLLLFGSQAHCNGRLLDQSFTDNTWIVNADIEGQRLRYRLPLLGEHAPLASVSVLLSAYYLGADIAQCAAEFDSFEPFESQGVLRHLSYPGGDVLCYDNASRASVLSYQSTLAMAARLQAPSVNGKKVAVLSQMIFLGNESEQWHRQLAQWVDAAGFDHIILVGEHTRVTIQHLREPQKVVQTFFDYDRRTSPASALKPMIDAIEAHCAPGDLLFIKGELDELGDYFRSRQRFTNERQSTKKASENSSKTIAASGLNKPVTNDLSVLHDLRPLALSDLPAYRAAIDATERTTWQHYFPLIYLLGLTSGYRFLVGEDAGSFCIYLLRERKAETSLSVFLLPMPAQPEVIERCIQRVKAFNKADRASLFRVDPQDAKLFKGRPNTRIVTCPEEYIYAPSTYLNLSGNKNGNLRRAIGSIAKRAGLEVLDYQTRDAPECKQLLEQWAAMQREKYGSVLYGSYTRACLDLYDQFPRSDLFGKVIRLDGKICSFGFAGEMRRNMGNLFIAYSDLRIDGLNRFLWVQLLRAMDHLEFVNGGNAGDTPGLAFAKQSLRPVSLFQPNQVYAG